MKILTDIELRSHWFLNHEKTCVISGETYLTPAARDFIKEHDIELLYEEDQVKKAAASCRKNVTQNPGQYRPMPMAQVPLNDRNQPVYLDQKTGKTLVRKPENMTHLHDNVLVPKDDPRIAFRGMLDSLEAKIMTVQVIAGQDGIRWLTQALDEVLSYVRSILGAEVGDRPLEEICLFGLDSEGLRYESHHIPEIYGIPHPMPDYHMGRICIALNDLRTQVREAELAAARAFFVGEECTRLDIIEGMNRLSSAVYLLFCRQLTGINTCCGVSEGCRRKKDLPGFPVEASGRHVHLTEEAIQVLFGGPLHKKSDLSQPGQYASEERLTVMTARGEIEHVVVLGPARSEVQVELSLTDANILGIKIPVNMSGDLRGAADVILAGPNGIYNAVGSAIAAKAHIHMTPQDAALYGVEDGDSVAVRLESERPVTIEDVIIRVSDKFKLAMHMDYDEANAALYKKGMLGYIV